MKSNKPKKVVITRSRAEAYLATLLFSLGFLCFSLAGWIVAKPRIPTEPPPLVSTSCKEVLSNLGYGVKEDKGSMVVYELSPDSSFAQLSKASLALQSCEQVTLQSFCAGPACGPEGNVKFSLKKGN